MKTIITTIHFLAYAALAILPKEQAWVCYTVLAVAIAVEILSHIAGDDHE